MGFSLSFKVVLETTETHCKAVFWTTENHNYMLTH